MYTSITQIPQVEILQKLIQFDTSNPPGNEAPCISYIKELLAKSGIESTIEARSPERPNLISRISGKGQSAPLLVYGHVDVVPATGQNWTHPPFAGRIADGFIWGRGALDMKGPVSMMLAAFLAAHQHHSDLPGDVILCLTSDEEVGGDFGARWLVESHAEYFSGIQYAISEFGGFTAYWGDRVVYPISISEKQSCKTQLIIRGQCGHGSVPIRGAAMGKLADVLKILEQRRLPVHITKPARLMFEAAAGAQPLVNNLILRLMLKPAFTDLILDVLGERGKFFDPLLHNTLTPTIVRGGHKINVIPSEIVLHLDGRLLPGFTPDYLISELRAITSDEIDIEVVDYDPGPQTLDMGWFETLAGILGEMHPDAVCAPLLNPGVTDARLFSRLGIQTYGFTPMQFPKDVDLNETIHAEDERIPVDALEFGTQAIYTAMMTPRP